MGKENFILNNKYSYFKFSMYLSYVSVAAWETRQNNVGMFLLILQFCLVFLQNKVKK